MKVERNRGDWGKYKAVTASKSHAGLPIFNYFNVTHSLTYPLCRPCHNFYISTECKN